MRISDWSSDVCSSDLWLERLRGAEAAATEKLMPMFLSNKAPISPYRVAWEITEFLTANTIYIGDGGDVVTITAQAVQPRRSGGRRVGPECGGPCRSRRTAYT